MTQIVLKEIDDCSAEIISGGSNRKWQDLYLGNIGALQVNGGNGVQNNFYIFNFNFNFGQNRHKK